MRKMLLLMALASCANQDKFYYVEFRVIDPVYIGYELGFFDDLNLELATTTLGGPTAIQAVSSGQYHAGLSSIPALINAVAAGLPVIGVSDIQSVLENQPLEEYFVRTDSSITAIEHLEGKKFAVNLWRSSFHYTALMHLGQIRPEYVLLSFRDQIPALLSGSIDVAGLIQPYSGEIRRDPRFRRLFTGYDTFGAKQISLHFLNKNWAEERPEKAKAFVRGVIRSIDYIHKNQEEAKKIFEKYIGMKVYDDYYFQEDGKVIMEDIQFWIDWMRKTGDLQKDIRADEVGSNKYRDGN